MVTKFKTKSLPLPICVALGVGISLILSLVFAMGIAGLINCQTIDLAAGDIAALIATLISAAAGTFVSTILAKERILITGVATGAGYYMLLLVCTIIFFGGEFSGLLAGLIATMIGGGLVILLGMPRKKPALKGKKYLKNR